MKPLREDPTATRVASGYTIAGGTSCWLTPGRLVVVEQQLVVEEYRRFELCNIQALILWETRLGQVASILLLLGILVFAMGAIAAGATGAPSPVLAICSGSALLLSVSLVLHRWRGPTARLEIHTAVQRFVVPGVHRWRTGLRMMDAVAQAARQFQGEGTVPHRDSTSDPVL
jgi:hypothetical protein